MGYDECRAPLKQGVHRLLDHALCLSVHGGGGLIEDEDLGVSEQGPRKGYELTLSSRQARAALLYLPLVPLLKALHKLVNLDRFAHPDNILHPSIQATIADVVRDRAREQERLLQHQRHLPA